MHVRCASGACKFSLEDCSLLDESTRESKDLKKALEILKEKREEFLKEWLNFHGE